MPSELRFDGRVVIVTGAGAGLGKAYALLFGSRGASVVVNDLGGGRSGDGSSTKVADGVVEEIRKMGGKAVANYDSVTNGSAIVQTAIDAFGRIDILINNAGILRDCTFAKMKDSDWDIIQDVHVKGAVSTTKAAWPHFRKQGYGKIIFTSSNSGLYGNFGQANYSSAKSALVGLARTLALEGNKNHVYSNVIVPTAGSRLTEDIMPPDFYEELRPELIAPVVAWLCHEDCQENGSVIESALGWAAKVNLIRSVGCNFRTDLKTKVTPELVRENWEKVTDMNSTKMCASIQEATGELMNILEDVKNGVSSNKNVMEHKYNHRDAILYALGVGATRVVPSDFRYLYENDENFSILPSYFVIYAPMGCIATSVLDEAMPGRSVDISRVLHGEQYLKIHAKLPTEATVETHFKVQDVLDKNKNAVILIEHETIDKNSGEKLASGQMSVVARGAGGFNGPRTSNHEIPIVPKPKGKPDATYSEKTNIDQAVLYRLNGDWNPLHIDNSMAMLGGFKEPILHGLCSLGFSTRHVLKTFAGGNPDLFDSIKVRFAQPVIPGETLQTNMWRNGTRILFETTAVERNVQVITGAYIDLKKVEMGSLQPNECFMKEIAESDFIFAEVSDELKKNIQTGNPSNKVLMYEVLSDGNLIRRWTVDMRNGNVYEGLPVGCQPDSSICIEDKIIIAATLGNLDVQKLTSSPRVGITGNIELLQILKHFCKSGKSRL